MESSNNADTRIVLVGILVSSPSAAEAVNAILHEYGGYVLGRMGLPLRERGVNAISLVLDAPVNAVNALTGKLVALSGVSAKALFR